MVLIARLSCIAAALWCTVPLSGCRWIASYSPVEHQPDLWQTRDVYLETGDGTGQLPDAMWAQDAVIMPTDTTDGLPPAMDTLADHFTTATDGGADLPSKAGDFDLVISGIAYEDTGTLSSPTWTRRPQWDLPEKDRKATIGDLDSDGDMDVILGVPGQNVKVPLRVYENTGDPFSPVWSRNTRWDPPPTGDPIHRDYSDKPALADLDADGDLDLLVGTQYDGSHAFENIGTARAPIWARRPKWDGPRSGGNQTSVTFADLDADGRIDLVQDNVYQPTKIYLNLGSPQGPAWSTATSFDPPKRSAHGIMSRPSRTWTATATRTCSTAPGTTTAKHSSTLVPLSPHDGPQGQTGILQGMSLKTRSPPWSI